MKTSFFRSPMGNRRRFIIAASLTFLLPDPSPCIADNSAAQLVMSTHGVNADGRRIHRLSWQAIGGATYRVQERGALDAGAWNTIDAVSRETSGTQTYEYLAPTGAGAETRHFFRVILPQTRIDQLATMIPAAGGQFYLRGECFTASLAVLIGGAPAAGVSLVDANTLLVTAGALASGTYDITLTDGVGGPVVATLKNGLLVTATGRTDVEMPPRLPPGAPVAAVSQDGIFEDYSDRVRFSAGHYGGVVDQGGNIWNTTRKQRPMFGTPRVNPGTGELFVESVDLVLPGRVLPLVFARTYRSKAGADTPMGQGWDHSYNIFAEQAGPDIVVHDGAGRADRYFLQSDGSFSTAGFFRRGTLAGSVFTLEFADKGRWIFNAFGGAPEAGKIAQSIDRNGNSLAFSYDGAGRLITVADPLGRSMTLGYSGAGRVQTLTDHTGRVLTYGHDAAGDLVSVTTPPVVGTPTGNDFPAGKTVTFAYTSGTGDSARDHNLTTITDAAAVPWFAATYSAEPSPSGLFYDRIATASEDPGSPTLMFWFKLTTPTAGNAWARTIFYCNDPLGNVCEIESDDFNRPVIFHQYTGRSAPGVIVTDVANRPSGQVRVSDPAEFITRYRWNLDSCPTDCTLPHGNGVRFVYEADLDMNATQRERGNLRSCAELPTAGDPLVTRLEHQPGMGTPENPAAPSCYRFRERTFNTVVEPRNAPEISDSLPGGSILPFMPFRLEWYGRAEDDTIGYTICRLPDCLRDDLFKIFKETVLDPDAFMYPDQPLPDIHHVDPNTDGYSGAIDSKGQPFASNRKSGLKDQPSTYRLWSDRPRGDDIPARTPITPAAGSGGGRTWFFDLQRHESARSGLSGAPSGGGIPMPGQGFATTLVDPRGYTWSCTRDAAGNPLTAYAPDTAIRTDWTYNANGQCTSVTLPANDTGHREQIGFSYYSSGLQNGWLQSCTRDAGAGGLMLTTTFQYNAAGCVTLAEDPLNLDKLYAFNALNELVRETSREAAPGVRYERDYIYDANGLVVRIDQQNKDEAGVPGANTHFSTQFTRDPLGRCTQVQREIDGVSNAQTQFEYDANSCLTRIRTPLAVTGAEPLNTLRIIRDERNLPFRLLRAEGDPNARRADFSYDENGNLVRVDEGSPSTILRTCTWDWEPYLDRLATETDAMGNETRYEYDAAGNCTRVERYGELTDVAGAAGNVLITRRTNTYDSRGLLSMCTEEHFDPATALPIGDGARATVFEYDPIGHLRRVTDDNGGIWLRSFDRANRLTLASDPKDNTLAFTYDANSNVTRHTWTDKSDTAAPDQVFRMDYAYDGLDRRTSATDNAGNATQYAYDSLNRLVRTIDPLGHHTQFAFDGLGRLLQTGCDMDGNNAGFDAADIVHTFTYDLNSRRATSSDDGGNVTTYAYDSLDRRITTTRADATVESCTYDALGNLATCTDANSTVATYGHNLNRRLISVVFAPGAGVAATTTTEAYQYDGRGLLTRALTDSGQVIYAYDSLGNLLRETQGARIVTHTCDGVGNRLSTTSPGGRTLTYTYDAANLCRATSLTFTGDGDTPGTIVSHDYVGDRIERTQRRNGTETLYTYGGFVGAPVIPGDYDWGCIHTIVHQQTGGGTVLDSRSYLYDRAQNTIARADTRVGGPGTVHQYQYDAANRLVQTVESAGGPPTRTTNYTLDGNGNRQIVGGPNTPDPGNYIMNPTLPAPGDAQVNQYTMSPVAAYAYDANGNRTASNGPGGNFTYSYDARDRLVSVLDVGTGLRVAIYTYDALDRRIARTLDPDGTPVVTGFIYDGASELEERDGGGSVVAAYTTPDPTGTPIANGGSETPPPKGPPGGTKPLKPNGWETTYDRSFLRWVKTCRTWVNIPPPKDRIWPKRPVRKKSYLDWTKKCETHRTEVRRSGVNQTFHTDSQGNTTTASDAAGTVTERYDYQDFGAPLIYTPGGIPIGSTTIGNGHFFQGVRFDPETGLHADGPSVFDPRVGRPLQRGDATANPWSSGATGK